MAKETRSSSLLPDKICRHFSLSEIQSATQDFDDALVVGRGGFGKVYKGCIEKGSTAAVAIKRLHSMSSQGAPQFWAEVEMLSKLRHCNLVSLIGYCNEGTEMALVYEYMPHGNLEDHLHKDDHAPLSWSQRLKICLGAARGLDYLHTGSGTQHGVIHRDVKPSNILLDADFAARLSDFGLAKISPIDQTDTHVSTAARGTRGYMDPCYYWSGQLSRKTDVYAFGVVLFEVLCGRRAVDIMHEEQEWVFTTWAENQIKKGRLNQIVDPRLRGQISTNSLKEFARIAAHCIHKEPKQRPTMAEVVFKLASLQKSIGEDETVAEKVWSFFSYRNKPAPATESKAEVSRRGLKVFTYAELEQATRYFSDMECGRGSAVTAYRGWIDERTYTPTDSSVGLPIYVTKKRAGDIEMDLRVEDFNHPNLAKLLGCCFHETELFCVYEFLPNGSLDRYLYGEAGGNTLSWIQRLKIAVGAAEGLCFLHKKNHMAYTQFKTSVIMLDADFNARLLDFQLHKSHLYEDAYFFNIDAFYAAPEWFNYQVAKLDGFWGLKDGYLSVKSEIYAFGVVVLELLTGQKVYDVGRPAGKQNLVKWTSHLLGDKLNLEMIMDPRLKGDYNPDVAFQVALLVSSCLQSDGGERPSTKYILQVLYDCYRHETKTG